MISLGTLRKLVVGAALVAAPVASFGSVFISVGIAPPVLPVYTQPLCPGDGYIWTPGYWAYGDGGYYWVPGVWVQPPQPGFLWTPAYWGWSGGAYLFHAGYWGPHIGFYGGINYGFGYTGVGYGGGYWNGGRFFYNRTVNNLNVVNVHNTYVRNVTIVNDNRVSFNGGQGGIQARPGAQELQAQNEHHFDATPNQVEHRDAAMHDRSQFASANGGHPQTLAQSTTRSGFGNQPGNVVNNRQANQQQRVDQGIRNGQLTNNEANRLQARDNRIQNTVQADRTANGGRLTGQERQQIDQRQNNVSQSIYNQRHDAQTNASQQANQQARQQQMQQRQQMQQERQQQRPAGQPMRQEGRPQGEQPHGGGEHGHR